MSGLLIELDPTSEGATNAPLSLVWTGGPAPAPGTVNLIPNPSFEVDAANWAAGGGWALAAGGTLVRDAAVAQVGAASGRLDTTATNQGIGHTLVGTFLAGVTCRISGWLRSNLAESARFLIGSDGTDAGSQSKVLPANAWEPFSFTWTPTANRTNPSLHAQHQGPTAARTLYVDGVMVIRAPADTDYFDGSSAGAKWLGTPHASASEHLGAVPYLLEFDFPPPPEDPLWVDSRDMVGAALAHTRHGRREGQRIKLRAVGASHAGLDNLSAHIERKVEKIRREGGVLKVTLPSGRVTLLDLLAGSRSVETSKRWVDSARTEIEMVFTARPYWRGTPVQLADHIETVI